MEVRPGPSRRPSAYLPQGRGPGLWGFRPTWTHSKGLDVNWLVQRAGKAGGSDLGLLHLQKRGLLPPVSDSQSDSDQPFQLSSSLPTHSFQLGSAL